MAQGLLLPLGRWLWKITYGSGKPGLRKRKDFGVDPVFLPGRLASNDRVPVFSMREFSRAYGHSFSNSQEYRASFEIIRTAG